MTMRFRKRRKRTDEERECLLKHSGNKDDAFKTVEKQRNKRGKGGLY